MPFFLCELDKLLINFMKKGFEIYFLEIILTYCQFHMKPMVIVLQASTEVK